MLIITVLEKQSSASPDYSMRPYIETKKHFLNFMCMDILPECMFCTMCVQYLWKN